LPSIHTFSKYNKVERISLQKYSYNLVGHKFELSPLIKTFFAYSLWRFSLLSHTIQLCKPNSLQHTHGRRPFGFWVTRRSSRIPSNQQKTVSFSQLFQLSIFFSYHFPPFWFLGFYSLVSQNCNFYAKSMFFFSFIWISLYSI
jgi:hypothetical protein